MNSMDQSEDWKKFQHEVYEECKRVFNDAKEILEDTHIKGKFSERSRQIDTLIKLNDNDIIAVDAKCYNKKVDVKEVESYIGMLKDIGANKGILISNKGFSKAAINRAHFGESNFEVDILSLANLGRFQGYGAIAYSGMYGAIIKPPFGWIVDGTQTRFAPALLYARGYDHEGAMKNKEWMYINFWGKSNEIDTIDKLIDYHNQDNYDADKNAEIENYNIGEITIKKSKCKGYPTIEISAYRDLGDFILFGVLFCPDNLIERDIEKICFVLNNALPIHIKKDESQ